MEAKEDRELESDSIFQSVETLPGVQIDRPDRPDKLNWRTAETGLALVVPKKSAPEQDAPSKAVSPKAASPKTTAPTAASLGNQKIRDVPRDLVGNILHKEMSFNDFSALFAEAEEARELQLGPESIFQDMETLPHLKSGANPGARRPGSQRRPSKANWQTAKPKLALVVTPKTAPPKPALQETMSPETVSSGTVSSTSSGSENVTISKRKSLLHHAKKKGKNIKKSISKFCSDSSDRLTKSDIIINRRTMSSSEGACKSVKASDNDGSISTDIKLVADGGPKPISKFKEMKNKVKQLLKMKNSKNVASTSKRNSQNDIPVTASEISLTTSEIIRRDIAAINKTHSKALAMEADEIPSDVPIRFISVHERKQTMDTELENADLKGSVGVSMEHEGSLTPIISSKNSDEKVFVVSVKKVKSEVIKEDVSVTVSTSEIPLTMSGISLTTSEIIRRDIAAINKTQRKALAMKVDEIPSDVPISFMSVHERRQTMDIELEKADLKGSVGVSMVHEGSLTPIISRKSSDEKVSVVSVKKVESEAIKEDVSVPVTIIGNPPAPASSKTQWIQSPPAPTSGKAETTVLVADEIPPEVPIAFYSVKKIQMQMEQVKAAIEVKQITRQRLMEKMPELNMSSEQEISSLVAQKCTVIDKNLASERRGSMSPDILEQIKRMSIPSAIDKTQVSVSKRRKGVEDRLVSETKNLVSEVLKNLECQKVKKTVTQRLMEKMPELNLTSEDESSSPAVIRHSPALTSGKTLTAKPVLIAETIPPVVPINFSLKERKKQMEQKNASSEVTSAAVVENGFEARNQSLADLNELLRVSNTRVTLKDFLSVSNSTVAANEILRVLSFRLTLDDLNRVSSSTSLLPVPAKKSIYRSVTPKKTEKTVPMTIDMHMASDANTAPLVDRMVSLKLLASEAVEKTAKKRLQEKMPHLNFSSEDDTPSCHDEELQDPVHQEMGKERLDSERRGSVTPDVLEQIRRLSTKPASETKRVSVDIKQRNMGETLELKPVNSKEIEKTVKQRLQEKMPHLNFSSEDDNPSCHDEELQDPAHQEMGKEPLDSERRGSVTPDVLEQIRRLSTKPANEIKSVSVDIKQRNMGETLELKPVNSNEIEKTAKQRLQGKMPHLNFSSEDDTPSCHNEELQDPVHQEMGKEPLDSERRGSVTPDVLHQIRSLSTKPANETKRVSVDIKQRNVGETLELKPVNSNEIEKTAKQRLQEKMPHLNFSSEDDNPSCHNEELQDPAHQEMGKEPLDSVRRGSVTPDVLDQIRRLSTKPANETKSFSVDIKQRNMGETLELKPVNSKEIENTVKQRLQGKMPHLNFSSEDDTPSCHDEELQDPAHQEMGKEPLDSERRGSVTPDVLEQIRRLSTKPANEIKSVSVDIKQRNMGETLELKPVNSNEIEKTAKQRLQGKMPHLNFSSEDDTPSCHNEELQDPAHQEMGKEPLDSERRGSVTPDVLDQIRSLSTKPANETKRVSVDIKQRNMGETLELKPVNSNEIEKTAKQRLQEKMPHLNFSSEDDNPSCHDEELQDPAHQEMGKEPLDSVRRGSVTPDVLDQIRRLSTKPANETKSFSVDIKQRNMGETLELKPVNSKEIENTVKQRLQEKMPHLNFSSEDDTPSCHNEELQDPAHQEMGKEPLDSERRGSVTPDVLEQIRRLSTKPANEIKSVSVDIKQRNMGETLELKPVNSNEIEKTAKQRLQEKMPHLNFSSEDDTPSCHNEELQDPAHQEMGKEPLDSERRGSVTPDVLDQIRRLSTKPANETKSVSVDIKQRNVGETLELKPVNSNEIEKTVKQRLQEKMPHLNFSSEDDTPSCHDEELQDPAHQEMVKENGYVTYYCIKELVKDVKRSARQRRQERMLDMASGDESGSLCSEISASEFVPSAPTSGKTIAERFCLVADEVTPEAPIGVLSIKQLQEKKRLDMEELANVPVTSGEKTSDKEMSLSQAAVKQKRDQMMSVLGHKHDEMESPSPVKFTPRTVAKANVDDPPDHWLQLTPSRMLTPEMDPPSPPELTPSTSFCKFDSEDLPPMPCVEEPKLVKKTSRTGKSPLKKSLKEVSLDEDLEMRLMAPPQEIVADSISQARSRYSSVSSLSLKSDQAAAAGKKPKVAVVQVGSAKDKSKKKRMKHFFMKGFAKSKMCLSCFRQEEIEYKPL